MRKILPILSILLIISAVIVQAQQLKWENRKFAGWPTVLAWHKGRLAVGYSSGYVRVFESENGKLLWYARTSRDKVTCLAWGSDGKLAVGSEDNVVCVYDDRGRKLWGKVANYAVFAVAWSSDGKLAVGSHNVEVFDSNGNKLWSKWTRYTYSVAWSYDNKLAVGNQEGVVYVYDSNGKKIWSYDIESSINSLAWSRDGKLAVGCKNGRVYVFNSRGELLQNYLTEGEVRKVAWSEDGKLAAASGAEIHVYIPPSKLWSYKIEGKILSIAWSKDGKIAVGGKDSKIYVFNSNGELLWSYSTGGDVFSLDWSNDLLAVASWSGLQVFDLKNLPGVLIINSEPSGAKVYIDDVLRGTTPLKFKIEPGVHTLRLELEGCKPIEKEISISVGESLELNFKFEALLGVLSISSNPIGADVYIDGVPKGVTPLEIEVEPGRHILRLELEGYKPIEKEIEISAGESSKLNFELKALPGVLVIDSEPSGAKVYIDGMLKDETPTEFEVEPGRHVLRLELEGYEPVEREIEISAGDSLELSFKLKVLLGILTIDSEPSGAKVYIDDVLKGKTPLEIEVEPGRHILRLELEGYKPIEKEISISAGDSLELSFGLEREVGVIHIIAFSIVLSGLISFSYLVKKKASRKGEPEVKPDVVVDFIRGRGISLKFKRVKPVELPKSFDINGLEAHSYLGESNFVTILATDKLGRTYAVKLPHKVYNMLIIGASHDRTVEKRDVDRLKSEFEKISILDHPNIVKAVKFIEDVPAIVMEYCENGSLKNVESIGLKEALEIAIQIADALAYAHGVGVVHRDVKPSNILFTRDGVPKLADFDIARLAQTIKTTSVKYTPGFGAPEQVMGHSSPKSDVYSLAATVYWMLSHDTPVPKEDYERAVLTAKPRRLPGVPKELNELILRCLSIEPEKRPSMKEFRNALAVLYHKYFLSKK